MAISRFKHTLTYGFLLPLLIKQHELFKKDFILNCFLYHDILNDYKYIYKDGNIHNQHLTIVHINNNVNMHFKEWENSIEQLDNFKTGYPLPTKTPNLISAKVLSFPEQYNKDYYNFLHGNYSKISQEAKDIIIDFHKLDAGKKYIKQTLTKDNSLRLNWMSLDGIDIPVTQEYWYKPVLKYKPESDFATGEILTSGVINKLEDDFNRYNRR